MKQISNGVKKTLLSITLISAVILPAVAMAQPAKQITDINQLANAISRAIWIVFGIVALVCFVIAGVLFLTSAGNPEKVQAARSAFLWGVAGVVVGVLAFSIVKIVENLL